MPEKENRYFVYRQRTRFCILCVRTLLCTVLQRGYSTLHYRVSYGYSTVVYIIWDLQCGTFVYEQTRMRGTCKFMDACACARFTQ